MNYNRSKICTKTAFFGTRKARIDLTYAISIVITLTILSSSFEVELVEFVYEFSRAHEEWELDEIIFSFIWIAVVASVYSIRRIQDLKILGEEYKHNAHHDSLTGLPNRKLALYYLEKLLCKAKRYNQSIAVIFIDLDDFKSVNDVLGHHYGDLLIKEVGQKLATTVRSNEMISRIGGDEFLIISELSQGDDINALVERIKQSQHQQYKLGDKLAYSSFSIGVALYPNDGHTVDSLIKSADSAMYQDKRVTIEQ